MLLNIFFWYSGKILNEYMDFWKVWIMCICSHVRMNICICVCLWVLFLRMSMLIICAYMRICVRVCIWMAECYEQIYITLFLYQTFQKSIYSFNILPLYQKKYLAAWNTVRICDKPRGPLKIFDSIHDYLLLHFFTNSKKNGSWIF